MRYILPFLIFTAFYSIAYSQWNGSNPITVNDKARINAGGNTPSNPIAAVLNLNGGTGYLELALNSQGANPDMSFLTNAETKAQIKYDKNSQQLVILVDANNSTSQGLQVTSPAIAIEGTNQCVGIGTYSIPEGYQLAVNGKAIFEEVDIQLYSGWWPDYVFAPTYRLRPLHEVEAFIQQHQHLPDIPSAAEVEEKGSVAVGELQLKLLQKVEELTLYIIELKKEHNTAITQLAAELQVLRAELQNYRN